MDNINSMAQLNNLLKWYFGYSNLPASRNDLEKIRDCCVHKNNKLLCKPQVGQPKIQLALLELLL